MAQVALQVVLVAEVARVMPIVVVVLVLGALPNMDLLVLCDLDKDGTSYGKWHSMAGWDGSCIHKKELLLHEFQLTTTFTPKIGQLFCWIQMQKVVIGAPQKKCQPDFCGSSFPSAHPPGTMSSSSACFLALKNSPAFFPRMSSCRKFLLGGSSHLVSG